MLFLPPLTLETATDALPPLLTAYWLLGLGVLGLKALFPGLDAVTSYGMHKADAGQGIIERRAAFLMFYAVGLASSLACLVLHVLNIQPTNAFFLSHPVYLVTSLVAAYLRGHGLGGFAALKSHAGMAPQPFPLALLLLLVHCAIRLGECAVVHRFSACERMLALNFVAGISFYGACVLSVAFIDISPIVSPAPPHPVLLGALLFAFLLASWRQMECHRNLAAVRPVGMDLTSSERHYRPPRGKAFQKVACPHYFFEILIYLALWGLKPDRNTTLLLLFVVANLWQRARKTHQWYLAHFSATYAPPSALFPASPQDLIQLLALGPGNSRSDLMPL